MSIYSTCIIMLCNRSLTGSMILKFAAISRKRHEGKDMEERCAGGDLLAQTEEGCGEIVQIVSNVQKGSLLKETHNKRAGW